MMDASAEIPREHHADPHLAAPLRVAGTAVRVRRNSVGGLFLATEILLFGRLFGALRGVTGEPPRSSSTRAPLARQDVGGIKHGGSCVQLADEGVAVRLRPAREAGGSKVLLALPLGGFAFLGSRRFGTSTSGTWAPWGKSYRPAETGPAEDTPNGHHAPPEGQPAARRSRARPGSPNKSSSSSALLPMTGSHGVHSSAHGAIAWISSGRAGGAFGAQYYHAWALVGLYCTSWT